MSSSEVVQIAKKYKAGEISKQQLVNFLSQLAKKRVESIQQSEESHITTGISYTPASVSHTSIRNR